LRGLPLEALLSGQYDKITVEQRESIYGRGWLLTHYLSFDPHRSGQLAAYLTAIARGGDPLKAAQQAFGDLKQLDRDLDAYMRRSRLEYRKVAGAALEFAPIQVSALSPGAAAVMPLLAELKNGVDDQNRARLLAGIRAAQSKFPGDPLVESTLAEIELEAGNPAESIAASDRALKADAGMADAMILKGKALMAQARKSDPPTPELFAAARKQFMAANKLDPEDPEPLMEYYFSYVSEGKAPTANAIEALHYASDLAPQDVSLRLNSALQYLNEDKLKEARLALAPIAFDPHGRQTAAVARAMIARIDAGDAEGAQKAAMSGGS
jgi:cytochrome c-type biogenesis protein CcmH/NrfG